MLAGFGETGQGLDISRVDRQRRQKPALRLGGQLGAYFAFQRARRLGQAIAEAEIDPGIDKSPAARLAQQQRMDLARDLPGDPCLSRPQFLGIELVAAGPSVFRGRRIGDLHVDPEGLRPTALRAAGDHIFDIRTGDPG